MRQGMIVLFALLALACARKETVVIKAEPGEPKVLAVLDGEKITEEDLQKSGSSHLSQAQAELYDAQKEVIDSIVQDKLLEKEAARRKTTKEEIMKVEVLDRVAVTDKDVEKFYNEKKGNLQGKTLDQVKDNLKGYLTRQRQEERKGELFKKLSSKGSVKYLIDAPRVEVSVDDDPSIGPKDAKVVMIEFTDYQCPFCGKSRDTVNQVLEEYKGKVRYVLRDFPLSFHQDAFKAHEGAQCAADQGKYWEFNKKLFANQRAIKIEDLKKHAQDLKLDMGKFNDCLDSSKYKDEVAKDQIDGEKAGVSGTPAFFINGRLIGGARPFANFKEVIDEELSRN
ncbi:MAG: DsbA family protein [Deltaproteobacteria bacterium]|nr:DsbA family protein [Deltaproteobacteria bacterium]